MKTTHDEPKGRAKPAHDPPHPFPTTLRESTDYPMRSQTMQIHRLAALTLAGLLLAAPLATAQEDDHEAHHPEEAEPREGEAMPEGMMGMMTPEMMEMMTPEMMRMMMRMMGEQDMPGTMRRQGMGQGMGQGMMGQQGMMRERMMGEQDMPGTMRREGMGQGMMGQMHMGMPGGDPLLYGSPHLTPEEMTPERVQELLEQRLDYHGNPRLQLGEIAEAEDGSITAEILTTDGALVQKLAFNRYPGLVRQLDE